MTDVMRPIEVVGFAPLETEFQPGAAPMLQWLKIGDLVVDDTYQRPIYGAGRKNVRAIAEEFCWSKFAPIIVAPVAGGRFAIIDGQHRATAAALRGLDAIPAQVIIADTIEQARAFKAINAQVTRIHALAVHAAALAAGETEAMAVQAIADAAGVTILRYPRDTLRLNPGETMALGALREAAKAYGDDLVVTALTCITETDNNKPGNLAAAIIRAVCAVLASRAEWRDGSLALLGAFDEIDLAEELVEATITRREKGIAPWEILAERLKARLTAAFGEAA